MIKKQSSRISLTKKTPVKSGSPQSLNSRAIGSVNIYVYNRYPNSDIYNRG